MTDLDLRRLAAVLARYDTRILALELERRSQHAAVDVRDPDGATTTVTVPDLVGKATEAQQTAEATQAAFDALADRVPTTYTAAPVPPYKVGDLWVDGTDLRIAVATREEGGFELGDWELKGAEGPQGQPGSPGEDGAPVFLHLAYANSPDGTANFTTSATGTESYLGQCITGTEADPTDPSMYVWQLVQGPKGDTGAQGIPGAPGADGKTTYTWIKYADSPTSGMSDDPTGKKYLGVAYNKTTATESSAYGDYTWALIQGPQGVAGAPGTNGQTTYTWIKYATTPTSGMSDDPTGKDYIGLAVNKTTPTESTNYADYTWQLVKGATGATGPKGDTGPAGAAAVSINLSADAAVFPGSTTAALAGSTTTDVTALLGTAAANVTVGTITGLPTGMSASISGNGTTKATVTIAVTTAMVTKSGAITIPVTAAGVTVNQLFTYALALTGATGAQGTAGSAGAAGADAYTVILTNDANTFAAGTSAAVAGSTTTGVIAYKGATRVAATVGTITGLPTGMSASISGNGTTEPVITFTVTTTLTTKSGTVTVPITVDGKSFTKLFTYALALTGATGAQGPKGMPTWGSAVPGASTPGKPDDFYYRLSGSDVIGQYRCTAGTGTTSGNTWVEVPLTGSVIKANTITSDLLETTLALTTTVVAGDPAGTHAQLDPSGIRVFKADPTDGVPDEVVRLGVAGSNDYFAIANGSGDVLAAIDESGVASVTTVSSRNDVTVNGAVLLGDLATFEAPYVAQPTPTTNPGWLDRLPRGVVASGFGQITVPTQVVSRMGIAEISYKESPGRNYKFTLGGMHVYSTVATDRILISLRYTVGSGADDAPAPTINSPILATAFVLPGVANGAVTSPPIVAFGRLAPENSPSIHQVRVLVCIERYSGTGLVGFNTYSGNGQYGNWFRFFIEDAGPNIAETLVLNSGGGTYADATSPPPPTPPAKWTYTKEWSWTGRTNYVGGNQLSATHSMNTGTRRAYQGQVPGGGLSSSYIDFDDAAIRAALSGAKVNWVEVYLYFAHWYNNAGGTARIGLRGEGSAPATYSPANGYDTESAGWPKPGGRWVRLPNPDGWRTGAYAGIGLTPAGSTSYQYYGYVTDAKIRINYTK